MRRATLVTKGKYYIWRATLVTKGTETTGAGEAALSRAAFLLVASMPSVLGHWVHSAPDEWFPYGLHKAAHAGDLLAVHEMEEDLGSILSIDAHGRTPLFYAAQGGHVQIVRCACFAGCWKPGAIYTAGTARA